MKTKPKIVSKIEILFDGKHYTIRERVRNYTKRINIAIDNDKVNKYFRYVEKTFAR